MARLSSERLRLHITNVTQYDSGSIKNMYEGFDIKLTILGREAIFNVNGFYELCGGNIEYLIEEITRVLNREVDYAEVEFCEPDFRFEIKRQPSFYESISERQIPDRFIFICWVNSGQWNGIYTDTEIGCKFNVNQEQLRKFRDDLQREWDNRKIEQY